MIDWRTSRPVQWIVIPLMYVGWWVAVAIYGIYCIVVESWRESRRDE